MHPPHRESHLIERIGWLRAAVLGANDGIISTASLVVGVAAASSASSEIILAGVAGEPVRCRWRRASTCRSAHKRLPKMPIWDANTGKLAEQPQAELDELTDIYVKRGVTPALARRAAEQMTAKDAFATHVRDELGLSAHVVARPVQAALTSAVTFSVGAALPLVIVLLAPTILIAPMVSGGSLILPSGAWSCGSACRGRWHSQANSARNFLGRMRNGSHSRYRYARRQGGLDIPSAPIFFVHGCRTINWGTGWQCLDPWYGHS